jgi:hypothetical protein
MLGADAWEHFTTGSFKRNEKKMPTRKSLQGNFLKIGPFCGHKFSPKKYIHIIIVTIRKHPKYQV